MSIPASIAEELARHLATNGTSGDGCVFTAPEGGALRYRAFLERQWKPAVRRAGLAPLRIHDLRHTAVALAVAAGAHPKEIQELCGHRSITTTLNVYGHLFESLQQRLAERLDDAFRAARAPYLPPEPVQNVVPLRRGLKNVASEQRVSEWGGLDSNQRPTDYESAALTN